MTSEMVGQQIEHYEIVEVIGGGGMGTVYRAYDINLARPVAIKIMHQQFANRPEFQQRFQQEAQAAARLNHPSIVAVYHFGRQPDLLYIVMTYVQGLSLGAYLKQLAQRHQVVKLNETLALLSQVADALGYAHRQGVVHRDVKPDNIIITRLDRPDRPDEPPLRAVMTDFGLAKLLEGGIETQSGTFMGTLPYMSPEQVMAKPLDGRSDIYSLGVILYQLATGQLPFDIKTPTDAVMKHLHEKPPQPELVQPALPPSVSEIILKALAKKPEDRYQTGGELGQALRQAAQNMDADLVAAEFGPESDMVSLVTKVEEHLPQVLLDMEAPDDNADRLVISKGTDTPYTRKMLSSPLILGRSDEADIPLPETAVSRQHLRLEQRDGAWYVVDLGSTNGSFLGGARLPANVAVNWKMHQELQIGPFTLAWRRATQPLAGAQAPVAVQAPVEQSTPSRPLTLPPLPAMPQPTSSEPAWSAPPSVSQAATYRPTPAAGIHSDMRPHRLTNEGVCRLLVLNNDRQPASVTLDVRDPKQALMADSNHKTVNVAPNGRGVVDFRLMAAKRPLLIRRTYPFQIQVSPPQSEPETHEGQLVARPRLPGWFVSSMLIITLLACGGGAWILSLL
ncbi:MAG: protein kinase [Chloroflexota bacterium]